MIARLNRLKPGTLFRLPTMPEVRGELLSVSDCSAQVRLTGGLRVIEFEDRHFVASSGRVTRWAPATLVEVICEAPNV